MVNDFKQGGLKALSDQASLASELSIEFVNDGFNMTAFALVVRKEVFTKRREKRSGEEGRKRSLGDVGV